MLDLRPILYVNGILLGMLAVVMLIPMLLDLVIGNSDWSTFATASSITGFTGGILYFTNRGFKGTMNLRQAFFSPLPAMRW